MTRIANRAVGAFLASAVVATILVIVNVHESHTMSVWRPFASAREYMVGFIRDKLVSRSTLIKEYNETMNLVKVRYEQALAAGQLEGKSEKECENYYLNITLEELRNLKSRIEFSDIHEQSLDDGVATAVVSPDGCCDPDAMLENWDPDVMLAEEEEDKLLAELDKLERQANGEDEMGWALTDEAREAIRERTKSVLTDLLDNEVRQVATAVLSAYLTGGSLGPVLLSLTGNIRFKLADFLMNTIVDLISFAMGRRVEIKPTASQLATLDETVATPQTNASITRAEWERVAFSF